jgi:hypothetical protein
MRVIPTRVRLTTMRKMAIAEAKGRFDWKMA